MAKVTPAQRHHLEALMRYLAHHAAQLDYPRGDIRGPADAATWALTEEQMRRRLERGGTLMFDCSQAVTQLCRWAGLADPNGLGYRYAGYTGRVLEHQRHYDSPKSAGIGAIVVYGGGTGEHESMVLEPGRDPLLWSHGHRGLDLVRLSVQRTYHARPVTFCSIAELGSS